MGRNEILICEGRFETKRNFVPKYFLRYSSVIVAPSKIHVTIVNSHSVCSMRLECKVCSSHGINPTVYGLVSSAQRNEIAWISKRNQNKAIIMGRNKTKFQNIFVSNTPIEKQRLH